MHVAGGHSWSEQLARCLRLCRAAANRGLGPPKRAAEVRIACIADANQERLAAAASVAGGFLQPHAAWLVACWWLLREVELAGLALHISHACCEEGRTTLHLPTSKADTGGLGKSRTLRCICHITALGDGGVRSILDALEFAQQTHGPKDLRPSISHLQLIHPDDQHRFAALGAVANFQALWALPDEWIINLNLPVVGIDRVHRMYPIASIVATGAMIVGGSDWSVSSLNPLDAIEVAVLRQDWLANDDLPTDQLNQLDVLNRSERVSLDTMLRAYTINAAWAMHQDQETGSLAAGKLADLVVLSEDLFAIPPQRISTVRVEHTFVDGEQVYPIAAGAR